MSCCQADHGGMAVAMNVGEEGFSHPSSFRLHPF
jgi:hypothetical protein